MADSVVAKSPLGNCLLLEQQDIEEVILVLQISDLLSRRQASLCLFRIYIVAMEKT